MRTFKIALLILSASAVAAHASVVSGVGVEIRPAAGKGQFCLDAKNKGDANGVPIQVWQCHGTPNQVWTVSSSSGNAHAILGQGGLCLDVRGQSSRANGTAVQIWQCHFGANQRFALSADGRIKETSSGKCLIASAAKNGAPLVLDTCTNTPDEVFASAPR
ncbi:MAG: RICIN domain-containing protein [Caulobacteraceae bacterium]